MNKTFGKFLVCGLLAIPASAASLTFDSFGNGRQVNLGVNGSADNDVFSGYINATVGSTSIRTLCVDYFTSITQGESFQVNALAPANVLTNAGRIAWLVETYLNTNLNNSAAAGLQLAVWDLVHDVTTGRGFDAGVIQAGSPLYAGGGNNAASISASIRNNADTYLTASLNQTSNNAVIYQHVDGAGVRQMLIAYQATPEPATWLMMASGLALIVFGTRRVRVPVRVTLNGNGRTAV